MTKLSAATGEDTPADCGNGLLDLGEQCDDGNQESGDACPSFSASECRFTASEVLARGTRKNPSRDRSACQVEWYVANPNNDRDRFGRPNQVQTCMDGDPTCDFDPTPGICRFRAVACLNTRDYNLPACTPKGVRSITALRPAVRPRMERGALDSLRAEIISTLNDSFQRLLHPLEPEAGYTKSLPIVAGQENVCTEPFEISVPVDVSPGVATKGQVKISTRSEDDSERPRRHRSRLTLVCTSAG